MARIRTGVERTGRRIVPHAASVMALLAGACSDGPLPTERRVERPRLSASVAPVVSTDLSARTLVSGAPLRRASGIAVDRDGRIFVADFDYGYEGGPAKIVEVDPATGATREVATGIPAFYGGRLIIGDGRSLTASDLLLTDFNSTATERCCRGTVYRIDRSTGSVRTIDPVGGDPYGIALSPRHGAFEAGLYVMNFNGSSLEPPELSLIRDGAPTSSTVFARDPALWTTTRSPLDMVFDPSGGFGGDLFVSDQSEFISGEQIVWRVKPSGALSAFVSGVAGPMAFAPGGAFGTDLYVYSGTDIVRISPSGARTIVASGLPGPNPDILGDRGLAFSPDGSRLYVAARDQVVEIAAANRPPQAQAGGPYAAAEGSTVTFDGTRSSDEDGDALSYAWVFSDGATASGPTPSRAFAQNGTYLATLTVTDASGASSSATAEVTIENVDPTVAALVLPGGPVAINTPVGATATFADPGTADTHTAQFTWDWDLAANAAAAGAAVTSAPGAGGTATGSTSYAQAGVYTVRVVVTDDHGGVGTRTSDTALPAYVVVYDPNGSFVTGGGWIGSGAGDCTLTAACAGAAGKASFGFVSRYLPGRSTPSGNTEFEFRAGDFRFRSTSYDWLVVAGARAQYKGEGTVNGGGTAYGFLLTAIDGAVSGGGGTDRFRIKVWDKATGEVVYDNQRGQAEDSGAATAIGGGSIVIHK